MHPKKAALVLGIVFLVLGVLSFIPALSSIPAEGLPVLNVQDSYGAFMGLFVLNVYNKILLMVFGVAGIWAYSRPNTDLPKSIRFHRVTAVIMGALAILGVIPQTNTLFGYMPLWGYDAAAHAFFAVVAAYFGLALSTKAHARLEGNEQLMQGQTPHPRM